MEPQFQSSFIPKKSVDSGIRVVDAKHPTSIFSVLVWVVVVVTIATSAGVFFYQKLIENQISQAEKNIVAAKDAFQPDTIQQLLNVSNQLAFTQQLLNSHILTEKIFDTLAALTVKKISFNDFSYTNTDGKPSIVINGESQSYNALAEQYDIFQQSGLVKNPSFSGFVLAKDGNISFKFSADLDPSVVSYKNSVTSQ